MKDRLYTLFGAIGVCALFVVPVAIAGDDPEATSSGGSTVVKKLKRQVAALGARVAALESKGGAQVPASLPPNGPAGGDLTASYPDPQIGPDAVGAFEIQNPTRAVSLPLGSFINRSDFAEFDYAASNGTAPDFASPGANLQLVWDDDSDAGGADVADTDAAVTTLTVPPDYAGGAAVAIRAHKDAHAGVGERFGCNLTRNGAIVVTTSGGILTTAATSSSYAFPMSTTLSPGDSVSLECHVEADSGGANTFDDVVSVESIQFRYSSIQ